jgi:prepilin-type N-terminal cleavage/methylation domain-containing protein
MMKGFTLIETLVAISILTLAMAAPFVAVEQSITAADVSRDELTANMLAQEGVEYVREVRDDDYLYNHTNGTTRSWMYGFDGSSGSVNCLDSSGRQCTVDPEATNEGGVAIVAHYNTVRPPVLYLSSGSATIPFMYNQEKIGSATTFSRSVEIDCPGVSGACVPSATSEIEATVTVTWTTRNRPYTTTITEYLDNWLQ